MNDADRADADHVSEAEAGAGLLPLCGLTSELASDLDDLAGARRSDRVAHRQQPTGRADGAAAAKVELARLHERRGLSR